MVLKKPDLPAFWERDLSGRKQIGHDLIPRDGWIEVSSSLCVLRGFQRAPFKKTVRWPNRDEWRITMKIAVLATMLLVSGVSGAFAAPACTGNFKTAGAACDVTK